MTMQLPGMSFLRLSVFAALLLLFAGPAAQLRAAESVATEEWDITADKLTRFDQPASIIAEGNIVLVKRKQLPPKKETTGIDTTEWSELLEEESAPEEVTPADLEEEREPYTRTRSPLPPTGPPTISPSIRSGHAAMSR